MSRAAQESAIRRYFAVLYDAWGEQHWWPAETPFEVIVGAYLTQNTAWTNVERALANLRNAGLLTVDGIRRVRLARLERLIRPSGYFRQKAKRLKTFITFLDRQYDGSLEKLFSQPTGKLRDELLDLNGIGPETADSILSMREITQSLSLMHTLGASLSATASCRTALATTRSRNCFRELFSRRPGNTQQRLTRQSCQPQDFEAPLMLRPQ